MTSRSEKARAGGGVRSYVLALLPNAGKAEEARYAIWWAQRFCLDYARHLYFEKANATLSTVGKGSLNHSALKTARDILRAGRASERATKRKFECPQMAPAYATATIKPVRSSAHFDWWAQIPRCSPIPLQPHRAFSRALRAGGKVTTQCQVRIGKHGGLVARVCVEMPRTTSVASNDVVGCDVGVNHGVTTSDGRCGRSLHPVLKKHRERNAERRRQGHRTAGARTAVKQLLDREARRVVTLAKRTGKTLAIESLATLGNLKPSGSIGGWARRHFGERALQIGEVLGVEIVQVHPAYTSQACLKCNYVNRYNRRGVEFRCLQCGAIDHADIVGARNIARKARGSFVYPEKRKGRVINMVASAGVFPFVSVVAS